MKKNDPLNTLLGIGTIAPFLLTVSVVCLGVWIARRVKQNN